MFRVSLMASFFDAVMNVLKTESVALRHWTDDWAPFAVMSSQKLLELALAAHARHQEVVQYIAKISKPDELKKPVFPRHVCMYYDVLRLCNPSDDETTEAQDRLEAVVQYGDPTMKSYARSLMEQHA